MLRKALGPLLVGVLLVPTACSDSGTDAPLGPVEPAASFVDASGLTVMSQNLYLGANLDLLLQGNLAGAFDQLLISNAAGFGRAQQLAWQIVQGAPHFVGLQEVTRYTFETPAGTQVMDYLGILQAYLAYYASIGMTTHTWSAFRNDLTEVGPLDLSPLPMHVTYLDADAILVRDDVQLVGSPTLVEYDVHETLYLGPIPIEFHRGYLAVTGTAEGHTVRFATTHLEVQRFEDVQLAQAEQLIEELGEATVPVVLVGDFNSAANHDADPVEETATYKMLRNAGYQDLWLREPHSVAGYTCCQGPTLTNPVPSLSQRLDLVLVRNGRAGFGGQSDMAIVGEDVADRITVTDSNPLVGTVTLWPSDHAGVLATFWPAPGWR